MRTTNSIHINAPMSTVYRLAAEIDHWPEMLPHYRWVTTLRRDGNTCIVEMAARRGLIPVKWTSIQHRIEDEGRILYKHIGGLTKGMWVEWSLIPVDGGIYVTIIHELQLERKIVGSGLGKWVVGEIFVKNIADKTLQHMKTVAEGKSDGF